MYSVELKNVDKTYDKEELVVKDVNVTIEPGEFFVLVGPSGCGKSTVLRMIAGLEEISSGFILIDGQIANHLSPQVSENYQWFSKIMPYTHI
ncbi:glycerol-3-phosphate ABC transporter UgpC [Gracilibacillus boraciitolerans JCM 21714]|uniref:Glycerol-3-phosphate ABC transporter UgpC n=1 Tax=Gracilibacillus boraciitolerans JCM 21714 TaxID=1298598 RepID=W4VMJ8_9BACI|nr:glycerol-3-phosphate ABC transporter UgpC [Gracilibacillus boraciitolerans JCM 21714]